MWELCRDLRSTRRRLLNLRSLAPPATGTIRYATASIEVIPRVPDAHRVAQALHLLRGKLNANSPHV